MSSIYFVSNNTGNWREEILEFIDADQLPVHWGGTQTGHNGEPKCLHVVSVEVVCDNMGIKWWAL